MKFLKRIKRRLRKTTPTWIWRTIVQNVLKLPRVISFEPISYCILDCEYCILKRLQWGKHREKVILRYRDFKKIINDVYWFTTRILFSGGEPLLNKELPLMLDWARKKKIETLVATNAVILRDKIQTILEHPPDELLVAYDPPSKGYDLGVLYYVRNLIDKRVGRYPQVILQMVLTKQNINRIDDFYNTAKEIGVDWASVKALGVWPEGDEKYDKEMIDKYIVPKSRHPIARHDVLDGKITFQRKVGQCPATKHAKIRSDGNMGPCWYIAVAGPIMGNAIRENLFDIWNSQRYKNTRKRMKNTWAFPQCYRCIGVGTKRWLK